MATTVKKDVVDVMIVEDYMLTRMGLIASLNEYSEEVKVVSEVENGEKALEALDRVTPDVILLDLGLPGKNGLEMIKLIKGKQSKVKIIVLTSHERQEEVLAALGCGASSYCLKDIQPPTLVEVIKNTAKGACWLDPAVAEEALNIFPPPVNTSLFSSAFKEEKIQLTDREADVLRLLVKGRSNTEIAKELIVSVHTAKAHVCSILQKLCVDDRVQAAVKAIKENLI